MIVSLSDGTGTAAFLGFDTEVAKLTHVLASEAAQIVVEPILGSISVFCSWCNQSEEI